MSPVCIPVTQLKHVEDRTPSKPSDNDGYQLVTKKRSKQKKHINGVLTSSSLETIPERLKIKSFVSGFSRKINSNNIQDSLKKRINLRTLVVTKLKTK